MERQSIRASKSLHVKQRKCHQVETTANECAIALKRQPMSMSIQNPTNENTNGSKRQPKKVPSNRKHSHWAIKCVITLKRQPMSISMPPNVNQTNENGLQSSPNIASVHRPNTQKTRLQAKAPSWETKNAFSRNNNTLTGNRQQQQIVGVLGYILDLQ